MKKPLCSLLLLLPAFSFAEISASVTPVSEYRSYGRAQTGMKPALQGTLNFVHESGFYYKNWASTVDFGEDDDTILELDTYFGYGQAINENISIDTGIAPYFMFGGSDASKANFYDLYFTLGLYQNSSITAYYTPDYAGGDFSNYRVMFSHRIPLKNFMLGFDLANTKSFGDKKWDVKKDRSSFQYATASISTNWQGFNWQLVAMTTSITDSPDKYGNADATAVLKITKAWSF